MRGVIVNTDYEWFAFLRERAPLDEVNFWQPSGRGPFHDEPPGTPFFFRLKKPYEAIGGFAVFAHASTLPAWLAWESFGEANGAPDFAAMVSRIDRYRRTRERDPLGRYPIGCLMLSQPVFFDESEWIEQPANWGQQTVVGRHEDLTAGEGRRIYEACLARMRDDIVAESAGLIARGDEIDRARFGNAVLVRPRLGQGTFRVAVTDAYGRACTVTGEHSLPALDAAHIKPYSAGGEHAVHNGLLLRSDIHRLFDKGYVTVSGDFRFEVSRRLKDDFENGRSYYPLQGRRICLPGNEAEYPDRVALAWHADNVFLG
ncbi:MAG: HNH endonuclease [Candidatus Dadabacteria bacterium]|nr:MAG: HNH endonuclease [Candidatus Dadabacteria bacterium]